jgi:tRNA dimethylallyltransferase
MTEPLIVIVGETASGKTAAAIKIALKVGGEIICADSRTVYKQMDIGTAKPTNAEQELVPHHLIDVVEPNEKFTVANFQRLAMKCIQEIYERGNIPIMVGGTGLYIDSVLYNFQFSSKADDAYRVQLEQMNDEELTTLLHTKSIDTSKLNTKNRRHVIRAIERGIDPPVNKTLRKNTLVLGLTLDKNVLKERITKRVEQIFKDGFVKEAESLINIFGTDTEALKAPGYKAVLRYLAAEIDLDQAKSEFVMADLQLAKRQRTWFKRNPHIKWFESSDDLVQVASTFIHKLPGS